MITGWQLLEPARRRGSPFVRAVVRFGDHAREVALDQLEVTLTAQIYQDDFVLDDPETENAKFDFVVWAADGRLWYRGIRDGLVELGWRWSTPEAWLAAHHRALEILSHIPDVPPAPGDEMPDDIAAAVEREVTLQRDPAWSADEYAARRQLHEYGGRMSLDVASMPIDDVRRLNARREIDDLLRRLPTEMIERARDAVRDVDIVSRIGSRSQFDEIEEEVRRAESEYDPASIALLRDIEPRDRTDDAFIGVEYVPLLDAPLDSEDAIEAEAVAVQRYERIVELSKRLSGLPTDADDIDALETVLRIARDYKRRSGE
jgi:hypothetical protein